ncbi:MAG: lamin tail domain-containing protein [Thermotogota bacterium]
MKRLFIVLLTFMLFLTIFSSNLTLSQEMLELRKGIKIINVHYSSSDEYVELMNTTDKTVNLKGLHIVSGTNFQEYTFGDIMLAPGEILELHSGPDATGLVWTYEYVHRDTTDGVLLSEMNGRYISSFRWGR